MARTHEQYAEDVGAFVLGALSELEASALERHAATCAICHAEIDKLRAAAEALPASVTPVQPSAALKESLMRTVAAEARGRASARPARLRFRLPSAGLRLRPAMAWVSAAFLLAVGIAAGAVGAGVLGDGDSARTVSARVDVTRMAEASASLVVPDDRGDPAVLRVQGLPEAGRGRVYQLWLRRGAEVVPGPLFTPHSDGTGAAAIPEGLRGVDAVMVTREFEGGARVPSEKPLIVADT